MDTPTSEQIIFFDGVCGLCNAFVDFVIERDSQNIFKFAPLQGQKAEEMLSLNDRVKLDSVVLYQDGKMLRKSAAVLEIFKQIDGAWPLMSVFKALPTPVSNVVYDLVAKIRYKIFGKKETCRIPTPMEKTRFYP